MDWELNDIIYTDVSVPDDGIKFHHIDTYDYVDIEDSADAYDNSYYLNTQGILFDINKKYNDTNFINHSSAKLLGTYTYTYTKECEYDNYLPDFLYNGYDEENNIYYDCEGYDDKDFLFGAIKSEKNVKFIRHCSTYHYNEEVAQDSTNCIINAIDIDWNDATISGLKNNSQNIKTTSDLIHAIQDLVDEAKIIFK